MFLFSQKIYNVLRSFLGKLKKKKEQLSVLWNRCWSKELPNWADKLNVTIQIHHEAGLLKFSLSCGNIKKVKLKNNYRRAGRKTVAFFSWEGSGGRWRERAFLGCGKSLKS